VAFLAAVCSQLLTYLKVRYRMIAAALGVQTSDILEHLADEFVALDRQWRVLFVNKAAAQRWGVPREQLVGQNLWQRFPELVETPAHREYEKALSENVTVEFEQFDAARDRWLRVRAYPMPLGLCVCSHDITQNKRDEEQLRRNAEWRERYAAALLESQEAMRRANEQLEERVRERTAQLQAVNERLEVSNRELEDFATVASHDLQEPLRKIRAFGDRLGQKTAALGVEGLDYLRRMQNAAGRMQNLINDLLAFARVTTKAQPFEAVDLSSVASEVLADLEARVQETGARVTVEPLPTIEADPLQMRQLLQNLLGNALKFVKPGVTPVIRLGAGVIESRDPAEPSVGGGNGDGTPASSGGGPDRVELFVQDNGIGFDEKYLDRIFNVFQRLHGRGQYEGTGIGLAVCRKIAERHGGSITATSRPGEGATFHVRLPARQLATPDPAQPDLPGERRAPESRGAVATDPVQP